VCHVQGNSRSIHRLLRAARPFERFGGNESDNFDEAIDSFVVGDHTSLNGHQMTISLSMVLLGLPIDAGDLY